MAPSGIERIDNVRGERQFENRLHPRDVKLSEAMATSAAVVSFHMGEYESSIDPVQSLQIMLGLGMGKSIVAEPQRCPKLPSMVLSLHYFFNNFIGLDHKNYKVYMFRGEQGWRSFESTYLAPMWAGFDSRTRRHMWVEFVVGSRPCSEGFSPGTPVFLPLQKPTFQIPIRTGNSGEKSHSVDSTDIPIF